MAQNKAKSYDDDLNDSDDDQHDAYLEKMKAEGAEKYDDSDSDEGGESRAHTFPPRPAYPQALCFVFWENSARGKTGASYTRCSPPRALLSKPSGGPALVPGLSPIPRPTLPPCFVQSRPLFTTELLLNTRIVMNKNTDSVAKRSGVVG